MKITVINGTAQKGVTYFMKESFLQHLREGNEITEFYPQELPPFCAGCKNCFMRGAQLCPHASVMLPLWDAILQADLLVFAYPVYALRAPASVKSLLDHLCVRWLVHRPEPAMFGKTAVIITNSVGAPNGAAQRDVKTSLNWMGVSRVHTAGMGMMGDIMMDKMSAAHRDTIKKKMARLAEKAKSPFTSMSLKVHMLFALTKLQHKMILESETVPSLDNQHYIDHGWIKR
ncbi:MAG: NAD(P)H-dependent oxidoreductase [Eubacteriales bacterium]|nr:NAD(P)H-dependent oxidoreductase [Eubacteriales bacterium]